MKSSSFEINKLTQHVSNTRAPCLAVRESHQKDLIYKISIYYPTDAVAFTNAHFGAGNGTIYLDNVGCTGSENNLIDCPRSSTVSCTSGHTEDAGVRCQSWCCFIGMYQLSAHV